MSYGPDPARLKPHGFLRGPRAAECLKEAKRNYDTADYLRQLVLRHDDLTKRLGVYFNPPAAWSGYVPPGRCEPGRTPNDSPIRAALVEICHEAISRERGPADADEWKTTVSP